METMATIMHNDNCWMTNTGEAFIDIGARALLEKLGDHQVVVASSMTEYYFSSINQRNNGWRRFVNKKIKANLDHCYKTENIFRPDYYMIAGMYAVESIYDFKIAAALQKMKENGTKFIFCGIGGLEYNETEKKDFVKFLDLIKPEILITRDRKTYEQYKDYVNCKQGIDCAFWCIDAYNPTNIPCKPYHCITFNRTEEPVDLVDKYNLSEDEIIRPIHHLWGLENCKKIADKGCFVSDSPYDYMTIYANAKDVYTDMVHATLICLTYNTPVKFYHVDHRRDAFDSLPVINDEGFLKLDREWLYHKKKEVEICLREILN